MIGIPSSTYYDWYARWVDGGPEVLADRSLRPMAVWNRIPNTVRSDFVAFALEHEDLTPREQADKYTDEKRYVISESPTYRILKAEDLLTAPAHMVVRAANEFKDKTTRPNELWQTDFAYLKVIPSHGLQANHCPAMGWGWFYLSTILDDYSRYIIAWKLCATMKAEDVSATLDQSLQTSGCDRVTLVHRPRLLSDSGSSYIAVDLANYFKAKGMDHVRGALHNPQTQGTIASRHRKQRLPASGGAGTRP